MTNYNERIDDVIEALWQYSVNDRLDIGIRPDEAKQALTSLIKELVAEAKPGYDAVEGSARDKAIDEFEQNLLKALEQL